MLFPVQFYCLKCIIPADQKTNPSRLNMAEEVCLKVQRNLFVKVPRFFPVPDRAEAQEKESALTDARQ